MPARENNILRIRARCLRNIRDYFEKNGLVEVDTPLLADCSVTDPYMSAMRAQDSQENFLGYLQTSPEYAMKKLLAAGSGDIFQLGKVFRANEQGKHHNSEFTMLEWYREGFDERHLMDEVFQVISLIIGAKKRTDLSYREAFYNSLSIDPFTVSYQKLKAFSENALGELPQQMLFDNYLALLFSELVEPCFHPDEITFVYDFPATQASLASLRKASYGLVARRFEAYCGGLELANGFNELTDPDEQLSRFEQDNSDREKLGYPAIAIDQEFIAALEKGIPACAGVAMGFDRLLMLRLAEKDIQQVLPMSFTCLDPKGE